MELPQFTLAILLKGTILTFIWIEFIWLSYLNRRQFNKVLRTTELPREIRMIMPPPVFKMSREYTLAKLDWLLAKGLIDAVYSFILIYGNYMERIWAYAESKSPSKNEILISCIGLSLLCCLTALVDFPFDMYRVFILPKSLKLRSITVLEFLSDTIIGFLVIQLLSVGIAALAIRIIMDVGRYFFLILWIICSIILSSFTNLNPVVYQSSTNLLVELDTDLKRNIENLCRQIDFPLYRAELLLEGQGTEEHKCVYYYGFFTKNVVISINIMSIPPYLDILSEDEILALLAHQLGHWYNNHSVKIMAVIQILLFLWLWGFIYVFERKISYEVFGFDNHQPILIGLMGSIQYIMMPLNVLVASLLIMMSRRFEFEADKFAAHLGMKDSLERALLGIYEVSFHFPVLDDMYSKFGHNKPTLLERIKTLNTFVYSTDWIT